jgi:endonuclease G
MLLTECLDLEPRLMKMQCCLTKGKALLHRIHREESWIQSTSGSLETDSLLETDDRLSGPLRILEKDYLGEQVSLESRIYRITNVTLLHLAARGGHEGILACLQSKHPNRAAEDSDNRIPQHYLQLSIEEGVLERIDSSERMFEALKPVTKLVRTLPQVNLIIHRKGYDLHYDTIGKVAKFVRQRLRKESFGAAKRTGHRWIDNLDIPELNRVIDRDYEGSGYDRGHLVPAEDATRSDRRMGDTFHPENAVPQNPNLNRGVWSQLEKHVHKLALSHDLVEVFTGPLFVPRRRLRGRVIAYPLMGLGDVHVPTHLFKIIFVHDRTTSAEVYIVPNVTQPPGTKFSAFKCIDPREGIDFIQRYSGILFREWMQNRPRIGS